jgi:hypothetical protein
MPGAEIGPSPSCSSPASAVRSSSSRVCSVKPGPFRYRLAEQPLGERLQHQLAAVRHPRPEQGAAPLELNSGNRRGRELVEIAAAVGCIHIQAEAAHAHARIRADMLDGRVVEVDLPAPDRHRHIRIEQQVRVDDLGADRAVGGGQRGERERAGNMAGRQRVHGTLELRARHFG